MKLAAAVCLACSLLATGLSPALAVNLPATRGASFNQWIQVAPGGAAVQLGDFKKGSFMHKVVEWSRPSIKGGVRPVYINAIYRFKAGPGHYTSIIRGPALEFDHIQVLIAPGDPLTNQYGGKHDFYFKHTNPVYAPKKHGCKDYGYRANFAVSPKSQGKYLYALALSTNPQVGFSFMIQHPGVPDAELRKGGGHPPWCPEGKGYSWGNVFTRYPLVLKADETRAARAEPGCEKGCTAKVRVSSPKSSMLQQHEMIGGQCPPGAKKLKTGPNNEGCYGCEEGAQLALASRLDGMMKLACLSCPPGSGLTIMRVDKGKTSTGQKFIQNRFSCLACPEGYQLQYPSEVRGGKPGGGKPGGGSYVYRKVGCWRCPAGKILKVQERQTNRDDGSLLKSRTFHCE
jgi:hypothetical protein